MKLYNTPTKKVEEFKPIKSGQVLMYTCGPTVYSKQHLGNYTAFIYWDTLIRALMLGGYNVQRVLNITDVGHLTSDADTGEDKMQKGAKKEGKTAWQVAEEWGNDFLKNFNELNLTEPYKISKATDYIDEDLELIRTLKKKGYTYQIDDGIYYDTAKFPQYAKFAHLDIKALKAGARVEHNPQKRNISDFALWKFVQLGVAHDMQWPTPVDLLDKPGEVAGFPGWHLECSTIIKKELGDTIDIHTGGIEHIPVHHTNEIAQSEAATGKPLANYWLHAHHITADGQKMSKSLNNGYTLDDIKERGFKPVDFKMWVLQGQFMTNRNFTFKDLEAARQRLNNWRAIAALRHQLTEPEDTKESIKMLNQLENDVTQSVNDNLNTPQALAYVDSIFSKLEQLKLSEIDREALANFIKFLDDLLGLGLDKSTPDINEDTKQLIIARQLARDNKDWQAADELRDEIEQNNDIVLNDRPNGGATWRYID
ncbi:cysteine--tRNA ligase [Candidatus Saccharibacteria bacterium]|nr:cysteine--tRNA ligase [Candidatus Saccharibacteria bacterium]